MPSRLASSTILRVTAEEGGVIRQGGKANEGDGNKGATKVVVYIH